MTKPLEWGTFEDKGGVSHLVPIYEENKMQPGHKLEVACNCFTEVRAYPNKIVVIHRVIH